MTLQAEYDFTMSQHITELLLHSISKFYEQRDKTSKLLAHRLRLHLSISLKLRLARVTSDPLEINKTFMEFYILLYS